MHITNFVLFVFLLFSDLVLNFFIVIRGCSILFLKHPDKVTEITISHHFRNFIYLVLSFLYQTFRFCHPNICQRFQKAFPSMVLKKAVHIRLADSKLLSQAVKRQIVRIIFPNIGFYFLTYFLIS